LWNALEPEIASAETVKSFRNILQGKRSLLTCQHTTAL
jgi:hypothetical protein